MIESSSPVRPDGTTPLNDAHPPRRATRPLTFATALLLLAALSAYLVTVIAVRVDHLFLPGNEITLPTVFQSVPGLNTAPGSAATPPTERINILLLGLDRRPYEGSEPTRSDTMMVLTLDPVTKTGGVLSIPRDLWVPIPNGHGGYFYDRINTAYRYGAMSGYRGGSMAAVRDTVQLLLPQVQIDYEAVIDFSSFQAIIETLGGVDVDVPEAFQFDDGWSVNGRDGNLPYFRVGLQHMDGEQALYYSRYRGGIDGDLGRIRRQQQVMLAVASKLLSTDAAGHAPELWSRISSSVQTDMPGYRVPGMALLAKQVGLDHVLMRSLGDVVRDAVDDGGGQVLVADPADVAAVANDIFGDPRLGQDGATVQVQNASAGTGMAKNTAAFLVQKGLRPAAVTLGVQPAFATDQTVIVSYRGKDYTVARVAEWLGLPASRIQVMATTAAPAGGPDIVVVLGRDARLPAASAPGATRR